MIGDETVLRAASVGAVLFGVPALAVGGALTLAGLAARSVWRRARRGRRP